VTKVLRRPPAALNPRAACGPLRAGGRPAGPPRGVLGARTSWTRAADYNEGEPGVKITFHEKSQPFFRAERSEPQIGQRRTTGRTRSPL